MIRKLTLTLLLSLVVLLVVSGPATAKDLTVMSRNLYLGADLIPLAIYGDDPAKLGPFEAAAGGVWSVVEATNFPVRARGLAKELKKNKPDLVGLQEAAVWRRSEAPGGETNIVVYDFIKTLLSEAKKQGVQYKLVVAQDEFDFTAPTNLGYSIRFTQRDAILVRKGAPIKIGKTMKAQYTESFKVPTPVGIADSKRGWVALDGRYGNKRLRFINTHLEAYGAAIRDSQAKELAAGPVDTPTPIILTGDLNSSPSDSGSEGDAYRSLIGSGLSDVFKSLPVTCCQNERVNNPQSNLDIALDHIMIKPGSKFRVTRTGVVGAKSSDKVSGLWPSDHAGVWARLKVK